jgi:hypothetical protein
MRMNIIIKFNLNIFIFQIKNTIEIILKMGYIYLNQDKFRLIKKTVKVKN